MKIVCYGCGRGMGANDAVPSDEVRVWYGLHDFEGCGAFLTTREAFQLADHVRRQNELPRRSSAARPAPAVTVLSGELALAPDLPLI